MKTRSKKSRVLIIFGLLILPILNAFGLGFIVDYIYGDITLDILCTILDYITQALAYMLPYVAVGFAVSFMFGEKGIKRVLLVAACYGSLLLPYICGLCVSSILVTGFTRNLLYYTLSYLYSYAVVKFLPLTLIIITTGVILRKSKSYKAALIWALIIMTGIDLAIEIEFTVNLIIELTTEYYRGITLRELILTITGYLLVTVRAIAGYAIMKVAGDVGNKENCTSQAAN